MAQLFSPKRTHFLYSHFSTNVFVLFAIEIIAGNNFDF